MKTQAASESLLLTLYDVRLPPIQSPAATPNLPAHQRSVHLLQKFNPWILTCYLPVDVSGDGYCFFALCHTHCMVVKDIMHYYAFLDRHSHCTQYNGHTSDLLDVNASFVQSSAIGPGMYVVNAGDLQVVTPSNSLIKYADNTYLVIPACNVDSRDKEITNVVEEWSRANNLTLNQAKSVEVIFRDNRKRCCTHSPSPLQGIARVTSLKVLGITLSLLLHRWMMSSARVHGPCTPSAYWGLTVWRCQLCSRCSVRSSSLSSLITPLRRGGTLRPPSTDSVSMLFCVELFGLTCGHCLENLTRIHLRTSATQLMMNCSSKSEPPTTFYMHSCQHNPPHHKITISDSVYTHFSYLNAQHISLTVTSWCACCTRTPTRPSYCFQFTIFFVYYMLGIATVFSS